MRSAIALVFAVTPLLCPGAAWAEGSGELVCERDTTAVQRLFSERRASLDPRDAETFAQRLAIAPHYCASAPYPSSVILSGVEEIRQRLAQVPPAVPSAR